MASHPDSQAPPSTPNQQSTPGNNHNQQKPESIMFLQAYLLKESFAHTESSLKHLLVVYWVLNEVIVHKPQISRQSIPKDDFFFAVWNMWGHRLRERGE